MYLKKEGEKTLVVNNFVLGLKSAPPVIFTVKRIMMVVRTVWYQNRKRAKFQIIYMFIVSQKIAKKNLVDLPLFQDLNSSRLY